MLCFNRVLLAQPSLPWCYHSVLQSPPWGKADSYSTGQGVPCFYGTCIFITLFKKDCHWALWARWIQSILSYPIYVWLILLLFCHLRLVPQRISSLEALRKELGMNSSCPPLCYMSYQFHHSWYEYHNNIRWRVHAWSSMLYNALLLSASHLISLKSKHSPRHSDFNYTLREAVQNTFTYTTPPPTL